MSEEKIESTHLHFNPYSAELFGYFDPYLHKALHSFIHDHEVHPDILD